MSYSSPQDREGILGDSVAQTHEKVFLESSSLVLGDGNSISLIFLKLVGDSWWDGCHGTTFLSFQNHQPVLPYNFKESMWGNENNWFVHLPVLRPVKLFNLPEPQLPHL